MATEGVGERTKVWQCTYCSAQNVTDEADLFSDQCAHCTRYNDLDWNEPCDVSLSEARAVANGVEAE